MNIFIGILVGLLSLLILVTAHELGHFIMARRNGVRVLEFGIGFPPRAVAWVKDPKTKKWKKIPKKDWKKPQDGLVFSLNCIPIGGFCQMDGESDADTRKGTFGAASYWAKTKILFGGVATNWLIAILIFTVLAWTGMPTFLANQFTVESDTVTTADVVSVVSVAENSPAAEAGFQTDDVIIAIDDVEIASSGDVFNYNSAHAGETVTYTLDRNGEQIITDVTLNESDDSYLLGITMSASQSLSYSTWSAPIVGIGLTAQLTGETFKGLGQLVWNLISGLAEQLSPNAETREEGQEAIESVGDSISGPVGIIGTLFPSFTAAGTSSTAFLIALISISLACMNVIPIPALDGGRWLLITIFHLRKKKLTKELEEKIVARSFIVLLGLIAVITIVDIIKLF